MAGNPAWAGERASGADVLPARSFDAAALHLGSLICARAAACAIDSLGFGEEAAKMALSGRNQDLYKALLADIVGDIKSSPRLREFRKGTKEPLKLPGMGKQTVPGVVWEVLMEDDALTGEWDVSIEGGSEFVMIKR
jgi:hypothetical protein